MNKIHEWDSEKNNILKNERNISFEEVIFHIQRGDLIDIIPNPNKEKYPNQKIYVVTIDEYIYLIPFIETKEIIFLKTIIPSRKATKEYLKKR
jgi:uncharacterized DUF497 family protein